MRKLSRDKMREFLLGSIQSPKLIMINFDTYKFFPRLRNRMETHVHLKVISPSYSQSRLFSRGQDDETATK